MYVIHTNKYISGASAPKKPKISPDTKTTKDAVYVHDVILKQNEVLSEEEKTANKPNLCNNTTSIKCVQEMKKNKRRKIGRYYKIK